MRFTLFTVLSCILPALPAQAQNHVPTFRISAGQASYTLAGRDPAQAGTTTIPTVLVPVQLSFAGKGRAGKALVVDAAGDVASILRSPVFANFAYPGERPTQYADALLRATVAAQADWHTLLGKPEVKPVKIAVPAGSGYVLTSSKSGRSMAIVDLEWLQGEIFRQIPKQDGRLVLAITHNTAYYALGDATVCCSWGTHGVDSSTGNSFVLASYLGAAPAVVTDTDVQPITQQLAQFIKDPLHDPLFHGGRGAQAPGNVVPSWARPGEQRGCGGAGVGSQYFLLEPTNTNPKNNIPASKPFVAEAFHVQNVALLSWYTGGAQGLGKAFSFPDATALPAAATPCAGRGGQPSGRPTATATPSTGSGRGHKLIGYWAGYGNAQSIFPIREVSPQWDIILVAFSTPDRNAPEGTMQFRTPAGLDTAQFKADIAWLKGQGKKVMISLGGGGQHFTLADAKRVPAFVDSVAQIVSEYGFDGVDIDFESPSLSIEPGDTDYRHPRTPSIVNLISALRQLRERLGPGFMISLVPEGTQIPAGFPSYGGQFGSYVPIVHALRDMLFFMDVQSYNTPPLQGLDGEIYQPGTVDYHAAMTELVLHGFHVGGDQKQFFEPLPAHKVAVGFLTTDTTPEIVSQAMDYLITGKAPAGVTYKLRQRSGYPAMIGAMFWTIDADRRGNYNFSNVVGPQLRGYK
ncbi:MAG: glycosyl hydrolase family 18 protein [Candidatus Solibacter sp.]